MKNKIVMLTGIPGVGKSTIAEYISKKIEHIVRIGFGDLILEVLQHEGTNASRTQIRTTPDKFVSINSIKTASNQLVDRISELIKNYNIILESHAVVKDFYGFWVIPEITNFRVVNLDAVIVVHTPFEVFDKRMNTNSEGRNRISKDTFIKYQSLQDTVAINFSLKAECPLYIVETDNDLEKTIKKMFHVFKNLGMPFCRA